MGHRALRLAATVATAATGIVLWSAASAFAATIVVNDNGTPPAGTTCAHPAFTTIQEAVAAAAPGDVIRVCAGRYTGTVVVDKTLTINGARAGVDARTRAPGGESIVTGTDSAFDLQADRVVLDGFKIQGVTNGPGVFMHPTFTGEKVRNNIIQTNVFGIYANSAPGTQNVIQRNLIRNNNAAGAASGNGIYADQGTQQLLVSLNAIRNQQNAGILLAETPGVNRGIVVQANTGVNDASFLANFAATRNLQVVRNTTNDTIAADNANQGSAIFVAGDAVGVLISSNRVRHSPFAGIAIRDLGMVGPDNVNVNFNTVTASVDDGISVTDPNPGGVTVRGNHALRNLNGIHFGADTAGNLITNNTALDNTGFDCLDESTGGGTAGTANTWTTNVGRTSSPAGLCRPPA